MTDGQGLIEPSDPAATGLSPKEVARATEIARCFDPRPCHAILQFGAAFQKRMCAGMSYALNVIVMSSSLHQSGETAECSVIHDGVT